MNVQTKKVTVPHHGTLHVLNGMQGPILEPAKLPLDRVRALVITGIKVIEHLEDGTQIELNRRNVEKDNSHLQESLKKAEKPAPVVKPNEQQQKQKNKEEFVKDNRKQDGNKNNKQN